MQSLSIILNFMLYSFLELNIIATKCFVKLFTLTWPQVQSWPKSIILTNFNLCQISQVKAIEVIFLVFTNNENPGPQDGAKIDHIGIIFTILVDVH